MQRFLPLRVFVVLILLSLLTSNKVGGHDVRATMKQKRPTSRTTTNSVNRTRTLQQQQTLNYRANYTADFQYLVDPTCTGDVPILGVTCYGKIEILSVSHPSIECTMLSTSNVVGGTSYGCINTCVDDGTCESVYMVTNGVAAVDGIHGSIRFMCEGDTIQDVKALYTFTGMTNTGSCVAADETATTLRRNLRNAQLGISCPTTSTGSGSNNNGTARQYVFDDTYFECRGRTTLSYDVASPYDTNDLYSCLNGQSCDGSICNFAFDPIQILTNVPTLVADDCVEALIPIDGFPTPAPQQQDETSLYRVQFEASWTTTNTDTQCTSSGINPMILLTCDENSSGSSTESTTTIVYVSSTDTTMNCINIEKNILQCIGNPNQSLNQYVTVAYDCYGFNIPSSTATYPESSAFCNNNVNAAYLSNSVSLGILCNNEIYSTDVHFECSDSHHNFIVEETPSRYTCSEGTIIGSGSSASSVNTIRSVSITTDESWPRNATAICYEKTSSVDVTAPPVTITVPVPTSAPIPITPPVTAPVPIASAPAPINAPIPVPIPVDARIPVPASAPTPILIGAPVPISVGAPVPISVGAPVPISVGAPVPTTLAPLNPSMFPPTAQPATAIDAPIILPAPSMQGSVTAGVTSNDDGNNSVLIIAVIGGIAGGIIISAILFIVYNKGKNDGVAEHKEIEFPNNDHHTIDPLDRYTEDNTDSVISPITQHWPATVTDASVVSPLSPVTTTTSDDDYVVHYKDQSRSVIDTVSGRTPPSRRSGTSSNTKTAALLARHYYKSNDIDKNMENPKPTSGIEIPMATAVQVTEEISMLGDSGSSIRYLGESNSSVRMVGESNRSFRLLNESNSAIPAGSNDDRNVNRIPPPVSSASNSSLRVVDESNRSFRFLNESNSTIPTESNDDRNMNRKPPPANTLSNSSLRVVDESNRSFRLLNESNSTIPTESNDDRNMNRKPPPATSSFEL